MSGCTSLTSVTIPESVRTIELWAFVDCPSLKEITIPYYVTKIGECALGYTIDAHGERGLPGMPYPIEGGFTIKGYPYTEAERYAKANGFRFVELEIPD